MVIFGLPVRVKDTWKNTCKEKHKVTDDYRTF